MGRHTEGSQQLLPLHAVQLASPIRVVQEERLPELLSPAVTTQKQQRHRRVPNVHHARCIAPVLHVLFARSVGAVVVVQ